MRASEELLLKLRDIQAPPEPPWWLLAPAWLWLVALLVAMLMVTWLWRKRRRREHLARLAQRELEFIEARYRRNPDTRLLAFQVSRWLKQVALLAFPERQLQRVNGAAWLEFLDQDLPDQPFTRGCGQVFGARLYQRQVDLDANQVIALCDRWLQSIKPRLQQRGRVG